MIWSQFNLLSWDLWFTFSLSCLWLSYLCVCWAGGGSEHCLFSVDLKRGLIYLDWRRVFLQVKSEEKPSSWRPHWLGGMLPTMAAAMLPMIWYLPSKTHHFTILLHDLVLVKFGTSKSVMVSVSMWCNLWILFTVGYIWIFSIKFRLLIAFLSRCLL